MLKFLRSGFQLLLSLVQKNAKRRLLAAVLLEFLSVLCSVFPLLAMYFIIESALLSKTSEMVLPWAIAAFAAILLKTLLHGLATGQSHRAAFETLYQIRSDLLQKIARLPMGFMDQTSSGKIKNMVFDDVETLEQFYAHHIPDILGGLGVPVALLLTVFLLDFRVGLAVLIPVVLYFLVINRMNKKQQKNFPIFFKVSHALNSRLVEYITGMKEIRIFSCEERSYKRLYSAASEYKHFTVNWFKECWPEMALSASLIGTMIAFVLPVSGWLYSTGAATATRFILYLFIALGIGQPMVKISQYFDILSLNIQAAKNIQDIMSLSELPEPTNPKVPKEYSLCFEHVDFSYNEKATLSDVSFTAPQGKITALVGPSGGGKSTIAKLAARFWDVGRGRITIGGVDVRDMSPDTLSGYVAFVTQNVTLFEMSIAENLRLGKPDASMEEIVAAAKSARCHNFISSLPNGYDTIVGAQGIHFSGGERQRISIARALLKNAPVLLLDEATAYADAENEDLMQQALAALSKDKTVLLIAHRLSTVQDADNILLIKKGRVASEGTHDHLLENDDYRHMWDAFLRTRQWRAGKEAAV